MGVKMADSPRSAPTGGGLVKKAEDTIYFKKAYDRYVIETQSNGEEAKSMDDWKADMYHAKNEEDAAYKKEMAA